MRTLRLGVAVAAALACACGSRGPVEPAVTAQPRETLRLGMQSYDEQQYAAARQLFAKAHMLYRSLDDGRGQVMALVNLADCALVLGEAQRAFDHVEQAQRVAMRDGLLEFTPRLHLLQAQALAGAGASAEARRVLDALLAGPVDAALLRAATVERARVAQVDGSDDAYWLERARAAAGESPELRPNLLKLEARAAQRAGNAPAARQYLTQALEHYRAAHYRPGIAAAHEELGALALKARQWPEAHDHYERALATRLWLNDRVHGAAALTALATIEDEGGTKARARRLRELRAYLVGAEPPDWRVVQAKYEDLGLP